MFKDTTRLNDGENMRVVIINRHREDGLGGSEIQCDIIARGLTQRGHQTVYVAVGAKEVPAGLPYEVVPVPVNCAAITEAALGANPTVVYWRFGKTCFRHVAKVIRKEELPFIFAVSSISDITLMPPLERLKLYSGIYGACKRAVNSVWNHGGFRYISGLTSLNPAYVGKLDTRMQKFIPNSMPVERKSFSWPRPYVAWVANIKSRKRPEICIGLARALGARGVDVLMFGKIQQSRYQWLEQPGMLPPNLHYLGPKTIEEINGVLSGSVALVHTCMPEGFGNNFIQAWLQAKPTVSFDFDPGGLIEGEGFGLVSHRDEDRFYNDVLSVIEDPAMAKTMGKKAQDWASMQCQPERNLDRLISFMQEVIETDPSSNRRRVAYGSLKGSSQD